MRVLPTAIAVVLVAAGCGSDPEPSTTAEQPGAPSSEVTRVAALGDSITAGNPGYDRDPAQRLRFGFGDDERSQYEYWAERAAPGIDLRNCGVFGERTDEIAERLDACAAGADALIVQGGINDIAQGRPVADAAGDLSSMVERGRALGLRVYLANVLPWNNGHPGADQRIAQLNRRVEAIGREQGVPVIDFHGGLEDPDEPGTMTGPLTADGDHPSIAGYRVLGALVARELTSRG